jgi:glutaredoxin 2
MKKHVYDYLKSNNGRLRTQNANLSEFWSLVPNEFNALTDEFVDASKNITIGQVDNDLQERLREKATDATTQNYYSEHDLQYGKYSNNFKSSFGHYVKEIDDCISKLKEERNKFRSSDRRREITQEIAILEEDKKSVTGFQYNRNLPSAS